MSSQCVFGAAASTLAGRSLSKVMPIGNLTDMTDGERATLGAWIAAGAPAK